MSSQLITVKDATYKWVRGLNAIPQIFIVEALGDRLFDEFVEIMPDVMVCPHCGTFASDDYIERKKQDEYEQCEHCASDSELMEYYDYATDVEYQEHLPMWGTMWTMEESFDEEWVIENLEIVYQMGFRVYEHENLGVVIGIDGAGYDFYEQHWIPLYKSLGFKWHNTEE